MRGASPAAARSRTVTVYKQGQYQGKPDNAAVGQRTSSRTDKVEWEKAIKARNDGQNEYSRAYARGEIEQRRSAMVRAVVTCEQRYVLRVRIRWSC